VAEKGQIIIAARQTARVRGKLKHLIITGDDFGRSAEINAAIERAHRAGFLTQASLMVNEPAADEAARIAARNPALCVGLHLTLCSGRASARSPLTDESGHFPESPARAGLRYAFRPSLAKPLEHEIRAQFERFRALAFPPTYWDGHTHLHLHPRVFQLALPIAVEHGFRAMRLVREPGPRSLVPRVFELLSAAAIRGLRKNEIAFSDRTFGLRDTGRMSTAIIARILENLPEGTSELYFHPGAETTEPDYTALTPLLAPGGIVLTHLAR
jgi:hopanoid biosynthesis associated protein HpnK